MPIAPDMPFPKLAGNVVRSKDWNDLVAEVQRLDVAKVNRGGDVISGPLTVRDAGPTRPATQVPGVRLHVIESAAPAVVRIQSALAFGPARLELWSDPPGSTSEWRPGYIQSFDNGGFTGGLSFVTNGRGMAQRRGEVEGMRLVDGRLAIGAITASPAARLHVTDDTSPAVLRVQSRRASGSARLELWSDPQGSPSEWRPGYIQSFDAGKPGEFVGGLSFVTNGSGVTQRHGNVEAMRLVNGRVGIGVLTAPPAARLHVMDGASPAVLRIQSAAGSGRGRLEMWSDPQGSANEWRPAYIESFDAGPAGGFIGGLSFVTNGNGAAQRQGAVEAMRIVDGRVGIGVAAPASKLDVGDRIRVRQGQSGEAGIWLFQTAMNADRAFVGMQGNSLVGFYGTAGIGWGLNMDVASGNLGVRINPHTAYALYVNGEAWITGRWRDNKARNEQAFNNPVPIFSFTDVPNWSVVPNMAISVASPPGGAWFLIRFNMNGVQATGVPQAHAEFRLLLDGNQIDYTMHDFNSDGWNLRSVSLGRMQWVGPGTHTVMVQWSVRSPHARPPIFTPEVRVTLTGCTTGDLRFLSAIEL